MPGNDCPHYPTTIVQLSLRPILLAILLAIIGMDLLMCHYSVGSMNDGLDEAVPGRGPERVAGVNFPDLHRVVVGGEGPALFHQAMVQVQNAAN